MTYYRVLDYSDTTPQIMCDDSDTYQERTN